jgi:multidrug transporter EmrE-like cation transporter
MIQRLVDMSFMHHFLDHLYIYSTILFTVYSQLILRWQVGLAGPLPIDACGKIHFVISRLLNPWILSGVIATFCAGVSWMLAMTKFEISYAYPFVSINYVLILGGSVLLFNEALNFSKISGNLLIILGIILLARG